MGKDIIYTVKSAKFTIDGKEWPINSIDLVLAINAIPYAVVNMPPHFYDSKGYSIQNPDLQDVKTGLDYLYKMADNDAKCNLELSLQASGGDNNTVKIECKDWILSDVSASAVSTVAGFLVSCKIQHPAYNLIRNGYFAGSLDAPLDFGEIGVEVDNIIDAADTVIEEMVDADKREISDLKPDVPHAADYSEIESAVEKMMGQIESKAKPSDYLEMITSVNNEKYNEKPIKSLVEKYSELFDPECLDVALCSSVCPDEQVSVWDAISQACALWGCSILPTFMSEKLKVFPITPWGKPFYKIDEKRIYSMNLPAYDANPLLGIKCANGIAGDEAHGSTFAAYKNIEDETQSELVYMPTGNLDKLHGRMLSISAPPWLTVLMAVASSMRECVVNGDCTDNENVQIGSKEDLMDMVYEAQSSLRATYSSWHISSPTPPT